MLKKPHGRLNLKDRSGGILLHPTSLPTRYGIGDLGPSAIEFADFLARSGQRWWQMLPIGPAGAGHSPYSAHSAFAGNPLLISPDFLRSQNLLRSADLASVPRFSPASVNYPEVDAYKTTLLKTAFSRFSPTTDYQAFAATQSQWLDDYALYCALREAHQGKPWTSWDTPLRRRDRSALAQARQRLSESIRYHSFLQFVFHAQWRRLKTACQNQGVGLIGDMPIFVSHESADVWARPELFRLNAAGFPSVVTGVPPDLFSKTGQRWGNPHYNWAELKKTRYAWWALRFKKLFDDFDVVRLDHFIGFHRFWEIPAREKTAEKGRYVLGPGAPFFKEILRQIPAAAFIAEDLGAMVPGVIQLRDAFEFPGMNVLQFAFSGDPRFNTALPFKFRSDSVVYTGTHDNNTTLGWYRSETQTQERKNIQLYLNKPNPEIPNDLIRLAYSSVANTAIIPMQDILELGSEARMNFPGKARDNWRWRMDGRAVNGTLARQLKATCQIYGRVPSS